MWSDAFFAFWLQIGLIPVGADPLIIWDKAITGLIAVVALALLIDSDVNLIKSFPVTAKKANRQFISLSF